MPHIKKRIYLDYNATAPLRPPARAAMEAALELPGNASSVHTEGRAARGAIERARTQVAALVNAASASVIFTSGASEANMQALSPVLHVASGQVNLTRLFVSAVEHPSVLQGGRFRPDQVSLLPVDGSGVIDLAELRSAVAAEVTNGGLPLVSVMAANNETGVLQPVDEIGQIMRELGGYLHVDAVQAAGRIKLDIDQVGAQMMSISSHKIGGPQGAGALAFRDGEIRPQNLISGGGQESRRRAGTENVAAIAGFGAAAAAASEELSGIGRIGAMRDGLEESLKAFNARTVIFGDKAARLANTSCFALPGQRAETTLIALDLAGFAVSSGSACSSGKVSASHVLAAMAVGKAESLGALRVSLGWATTSDDIDGFIDFWRQFSR